MINLNNDLTLVFTRLEYDFVHKQINYTFQLFPTSGTTAGLSADEYKRFQVSVFRSDRPEMYDSMIGKSKSEINQILLNQWNLYNNPETRDQVAEVLVPIMEYVDNVGLA